MTDPDSMKARVIRSKMGSERSAFDERNRALVSKAEAALARERRFWTLPRSLWTREMWKEYNDQMARRAERGL